MAHSLTNAEVRSVRTSSIPRMVTIVEAFAVLTALGAMVRVGGPIPMTLQTLVVIAAGLMAGPWLGRPATGDPVSATVFSFFFLDGGGVQAVNPAWLLVVVAFFGVHFALRYELWPRLVGRLNDWSYAAAYGTGSALVLAFMATEYQPFIYFQF